MADPVSGFFSGAFGFLWVGAGVVGWIMLVSKSKLRLGFMGWLLYGWWISAFAVILVGPFLLLWGWLSKAPVKCASCRKEVDRQATKCPYCQSNLVPQAAPAS